MGSRRQMAAAALVLCVMAFYTSPAGGGTAEPLTNGDFLRFHVIGHSDSREDQELKLKVRDGLLEEIDRELAMYTMAQADPGEDRVELTLEQSRAFVADHLEEIAETGQKIVRTLGYDYPVTARLEVCQIPEKTYGNATFPEGQYEALNVTIGSGSGQNWWCVLFPPLCLVGAESMNSAEETAPGRGQFPREVGLDPKYDQLISAVRAKQPVKLELRFKTLELLDQL